MSGDWGGDIQVSAEVNVVSAECSCADYCCVSEFRGQRCFFVVSKSTSTTSRPPCFSKLMEGASTLVESEIGKNEHCLKSSNFIEILYWKQRERTALQSSRHRASGCEGCFLCRPVVTVPGQVFLIAAWHWSCSSADGRLWAWSTRGDAATDLQLCSAMFGFCE